MRLREPDLDLLSGLEVAHCKGIVEGEVAALLREADNDNSRTKQNRKFLRMLAAPRCYDGVDGNDRPGPSEGATVK